MRFLLALALLGGLVGPAVFNAVGSMPGGNLLVNGGFNLQGYPYPSDLNLILAPWSWSGSIAYSWSNTRSEVGPGVTLDTGGIVGFSDGYIYQDVATTPGQVYELTITAFSRSTTTGTQLQPLWNGAGLAPGLVPVIWTALTYEIQAAESSTRLVIMPVAGNDGPTWVDSVSLVAVPEPSALAMLTVFVALGVSRERRSA